MSYFPPVAEKITTYRKYFTNSDLSNGSITVQHDLDEDFPVFIVYNSDREVVMPDGVLSLDQDNLYFVFTSFGNIVGNWCIAIGK